MLLKYLRQFKVFKLKGSNIIFDPFNLLFCFAYYFNIRYNAKIIPGNQKNNVRIISIQKFVVTPSKRYTARGGSKIANITNNTSSSGGLTK